MIRVSRERKYPRVERDSVERLEQQRNERVSDRVEDVEVSEQNVEKMRELQSAGVTLLDEKPLESVRENGVPVVHSKRHRGDQNAQHLTNERTRLRHVRLQDARQHLTIHSHVLMKCIETRRYWERSRLRITTHMITQHISKISFSEYFNILI